MAASSPLGSRLDISDTQLLDAGIAVLADKGLAGLTLRPLAQELGVSVSAVTNRFGQKTDILNTICATGADLEARVLEDWETRIGHDAILTPDALADVADAVLDTLARSQTGLSYLHCELVQAAAWQPEIRPALARWLDRRAIFWARLTARCPVGRPYDLGATLHAYAIDEIVHGLALGDDPNYRWLRKLGLRRLCSGIFADADIWTESSFAAVSRVMSGTGEDGRYRPATRSKMASDVAPFISDLIIEGGSEAVTHRSVGLRAGIAATTLVHHFPRQVDLLRAGLDTIIAIFHGEIDERRNDIDSQFSRGPTVAAATFAIALAAVRFPELRPVAADMRRRRGENGYVYFQQISDSPDRIDRLAAQAISVAGVGATLLQRALGEDGPVPLLEALIRLCRSPNRP